MENLDTKSQIKRYIAGEMNNLQRKRFISELDDNPELQKELFIYAMQHEEEEIPENKDVRSRITEIRKRISPLPEVRLSWWDHVRFTVLEWTRLLKWISIVILLGFSVLFIWTNTNLSTIENLVQNYSKPAYCPGIAGAEDLDLASIYKSSSDFYCELISGSLDSLRALSAECNGFCIANYYLAHEELKNGFYEEAERNFLICLNRWDELTLDHFKPNVRELEFNLYLAALGQENKKKQALESLESFRASSSGDIQVETTELLQKLKKTLRVLLID